jgi:CheY-like chemotaxis protein
MILTANQHLLGLIDEVMDLSRIESGQVSISLEPVPVAPLLTSALDLMGPLADTHGVAIHPPAHQNGARYVIADAQRLKQILINLISNAIKYNRDGGEVRLAVTPAENRVRVSVTDTGRGIDEASIQKLFVPFERLDAGSSGVQGTGLGLALSRSLVEAMGGSIGVESARDSGSTFWVELARAEPAAVREPSPEERSLLSVRAYATERRLLYIEDTVANVRLIEDILNRRPSIQVLPAMLGQLGLELARDHRPELILLDLHLPDLEGSQVLAQLQADEDTRDIPVVIISADATKQQLEPLLAAGARDYLTKPIGVRQFLEVVDSFLADPDVD